MATVEQFLKYGQIMNGDMNRRKGMLWSVRDYALRYFDEVEVEDFGLWAFGEHYKKLYPLEAMREWNLRHGDWYKCNRKNEIADDVEEMVAIYRLCMSTNRKRA